MRTQEERIKQLHKRANEIKRHDEKIKTSGLGIFCMALLGLLVTSIMYVNNAFHSAVRINAQGSSLLSESTGGYVLAAVIAFFAGVIITVVIFRHKNRNSK